MCLKAAFVFSILAICLIVPAHLLSWYGIFIGEGNFHLQPSTSSSITANGTMVALDWTSLHMHEISTSNIQNAFSTSLFDANNNKTFTFTQMNMTHVEQSFTTSLYTLVAAGALTMAMIPMLFCLCCEQCCECCQRSTPHHTKSKIAICVMSLIALGAIAASVATFTKLPTSFSDDDFCGNRLVLVNANGVADIDFDWLVENPGQILSRGNESFWCGSILDYNFLVNLTRDISVAWSPLPGYWCAASSAVPIMAVLFFTVASFLCCNQNDSL